MVKSITLIILILLYVIFSIWISNKIVKSIFLDKNQKRINLIIIWLVPFLWGFLVKLMIGSTDNKTVTKKSRKKSKSKNSDNWESLTGYGGDADFFLNLDISIAIISGL